MANRITVVLGFGGSLIIGSLDLKNHRQKTKFCILFSLGMLLLIYPFFVSFSSSNILLQPKWVYFFSL
jgi:hypothetical protein